jgi:SAM-dependent methyltransferase
MMRTTPEVAAAVKRHARQVLPVPVHRMINRLRMRRSTRPFEGLTNRTVFSRIYSNSNYWGNLEGNPFTSGEGTSAAEVTDPYVNAVSALLDSFAEPPDVVDLGCGDFTVGVRLRPHCGAYTACDVVPEVVESNRHRYGAAGVDFLTIDIAEDPLPPGDVVFIRQVLQHLSNADIAAVVPKLSAFAHVIVTEHVPARTHRPNIDMPTGPWTRLSLLSGVDIAAAPFDFRFAARSVICEVPQPTSNSVIRTTHYLTR